MREDDQEFARVSRLRQTETQAVEVGLDHRPHGGVGDGGGKPLELLDARQHVR